MGIFGARPYRNGNDDSSYKCNFRFNPGHLTMVFLPQPGWRIRGELTVVFLPPGAPPTQKLDGGLFTTRG